METLKLKTNIKCSGCIEKVTPYLDETAGKGNWEVDLSDPQKTLSILPAAETSMELVKEALEKAGYRGEATA